MAILCAKLFRWILIAAAGRLTLPFLTGKSRMRTMLF